MSESLRLRQHYIYLIAGLTFLICYWYWGYDGITFSDDVDYILLGQDFWGDRKLLSDDHFSLRWGAFLLSGLITHLFQLNDHLASLSSLMYYGATLLLIWSILPKRAYKIWFTIFFVSNIYLLHFLPKLYPDSSLVFWSALIPVAASKRHQYPVEAAILMGVAFFVGFCTKETIIYLAPFPLLLLFVDIKRQNPKRFYFYFFGFISLLTALYLGYFMWKYGDPLYRFHSIQEGHYASPYSYFDKGWVKILERITFIPITTFIERAYWVWIVLSVPSIYRAFHNKKDLSIIFSLASICLILGFWLMTTSFTYYNPIHLNPRHLIILIPFLSANIALESSRWQNHFFWNRFCALWIGFGGVISFAQLDWKMGCYYLLFASALFFLKKSSRLSAIVVLMLLPVFAAVHFQRNLKNYPHFKNEFISTIRKSTSNAPLISHDFVCHSQQIILGKTMLGKKALSFDEFQTRIKGNLPENFTLFFYKYSQHAYPDEADLLTRIHEFAQQNHFIQTDTKEDKWLKIIRFKKVDPLSPNSYGDLAMAIPEIQEEKS